MYIGQRLVKEQGKILDRYIKYIKSTHPNGQNQYFKHVDHLKVPKFTKMWPPNQKINIFFQA